MMIDKIKVYYMAAEIPFPFSDRGAYATKERMKYLRRPTLDGLTPSLSFVLFCIEHEGMSVIESNPEIKRFFEQLPHFSENVTILINTHAYLLPPFETPLPVTRYISSENGTCTFNQVHNRAYTLDIIRSRKKDFHEYLIEDILSQPRFKTTELTDECDQERHDRFCASKHHRTPKTFPVGASMFNKRYNLDPMQPLGTGDRAIVLRDDTGNMLELTTMSDVWYLNDILQLVQLQGGRQVTLFDYSCSEYASNYDIEYGKPITPEKKEADLLEYGGKTKRRLRRKKTRRYRLR